MKSKELFPVVGGLTALLVMFTISGCTYNGDPMLDGTFIEEETVSAATNVPPMDLSDEFSIPADDPFIGAFQALSAELSMAIGITFLETCSTGPKTVGSGI